MLEEIYKLEVTLKLVSGLYIGGTDNGFDIGGADSNVIKNPLTKEPYIPGSSMKGKLKSLLKYHHGELNEKNDDFIFSDDTIKNIFEPVEDSNVSITRAIFRDFTLTKESVKELQTYLGLGAFTEIKAENSIDIIKGKAANPRFIERVPAGAIFEGEIVLNVFEGDKKEKMMETIKESLKLLESNYLGGSGTRGYGRVEISFDDFKVVDL